VLLDQEHQGEVALQWEALLNLAGGLYLLAGVAGFILLRRSFATEPATSASP